MALLSLMARLGSADPVELQTDMGRLIDGFDVTRFGSAPTKFDEADLYPLTAHYLQTLPLSEVRDHVAALGVPDDMAEPFWLMARENITTLGDLGQWWALCRDGAEPLVAPEDANFIAQAMAMLPPAPFDDTTWGTWTSAVKEATGRKGKQLFMPLRKAVTGQERGPEMAALLPLMQVIRARG